DWVANTTVDAYARGTMPTATKNPTCRNLEAILMAISPESKVVDFRFCFRSYHRATRYTSYTCGDDHRFANHQSPPASQQFPLNLRAPYRHAGSHHQPTSLPRSLPAQLWAKPP